MEIDLSNLLEDIKVLLLQSLFKKIKLTNNQNEWEEAMKRQKYCDYEISEARKIRPFLLER